MPVYSSANNQPVDEEEEFQRKKKLSNKLSLISLILHLVFLFGTGIFSAIVGAIADADTSSFLSYLTPVFGASYTASIVLMIVARVKCKKATFGKVLMWIYIAEMILMVIAVIVCIIFFAWLIATCSQGSW